MVVVAEAELRDDVAAPPEAEQTAPAAVAVPEAALLLVADETTVPRPLSDIFVVFFNSSNGNSRLYTLLRLLMRTKGK